MDFLHCYESLRVDTHHTAIRDVTPYGSVTPGEHEFRVSLVGDESGASAINSTQTIESGQAYTILILSSEAGIEIKSYQVNLDRTPAAKARVRTINAAVGTDVSIFVTQALIAAIYRHTVSKLAIAVSTAFEAAPTSKCDRYRVPRSCKYRKGPRGP
jgi:Domain of unknown function (DUF4397)